MDADAEGLTYTPQWCVGSTGAERTNEVFYDNVKVPKNRLVGEINKGFIYLMQALDYERFAIISFAARVRRFNKVAEWVNDYYSIYPSAASTTLDRDPLGPEEGDYHVIRGSSWMDSTITELRLSYRDYGNKRRSALGFRIARYSDQAKETP